MSSRANCRNGPFGDFGDDQGPRRRRRRRGRRGGRGRNKNRGEFDNNEPQNRAPQNRPPARPEIAGPVRPDDEPNGNVAPPPIDDDEIVEPEHQPDIGNSRDDPQDADRPPRRRRPRGGRRRRGRGPGNELNANQPQLPAPNSNTNNSGRPNEPRAREMPNAIRTGSADKHLIQDEPIAPQPVSRPRSHRDLDSIPDDYD